MKLSLILLQSSSNSDFLPTFFAFLVGVAICLGIFLLIRSIMLWYWKIDIIVTTQTQQNAYLQKLVQLIAEQNKLLSEFKAQSGNSPIDPNAEQLRH